MQSLMNFNNFQFEYDPYPVAVSEPFFDREFCKELVNDFPPIEAFSSFREDRGLKKRLNETADLSRYREVIRGSRAYGELYRYIKSKEFIRDVLSCLEENNIELRLSHTPITSSTLPVHNPTLVPLNKLLRRLSLSKTLSARFEFSALSSVGGSIMPHTDAPAKIITLVVALSDEGEWDSAWGGGTDILKPKDPKKSYNFFNRYLPYEECTVLRTTPYTPNQCMLFIKTHNSLHGVQPIQGIDPSVYRKTLTINIEWV